MKRCAIYTRKSSSEGLSREFTTLDAQRQFCRSYIASQAGEGWVALDTRYDDGGFSGGSLERPAVRRLMADVAAGLIDTVVVYKIDRLSRSLVDFAALIGRFEAYKVSFVAVTQSFNTTSSMGRLTLNVLLSFAQFERELASERLRDKAAASRSQGLWQVGQRPFGYRVEEGHLLIDEKEAGTVRYAFQRYPKIRTAKLVANELTRRGALNKMGRPFTKSSVTKMLRNRLYRGDLVHHGDAIPGIHEAIVTEKQWQKARHAMAEVASECRPQKHPPIPNPFKGLLFGSGGRPLSHNFGHNRNRLHRYYIPSGRPRRKHGSGDNYRASEFDAAVLASISDLVSNRRDGTLDELADARNLIARIDVGQNEMTIRLRSGEVRRTAVAGRTKPAL